MTATQFRRLLAEGETLRSTCRGDYGAGYVRGLRRCYHGENFGTAEEHALLLAAVESEDASRAERGRGYRDGLAGRRPQWPER